MTPGKKNESQAAGKEIRIFISELCIVSNMTVEKNIAAGLRGKKAEKEKRVREMIEKFRLQGLEHRLPGELSGGQQQRTALRALWHMSRK